MAIFRSCSLPFPHELSSPPSGEGKGRDVALRKEQSNPPAEALALLVLLTLGSSRWKWETFLEERLKGHLIS